MNIRDADDILITGKHGDCLSNGYDTLTKAEKPVSLLAFSESFGGAEASNVTDGTLQPLRKESPPY